MKHSELKKKNNSNEIKSISDIIKETEIYKKLQEHKNKLINSKEESNKDKSINK